MKSSPNSTPTASGPPPRASVTTRIATPEADDRHREDPDGELIALVGRGSVRHGRELRLPAGPAYRAMIGMIRMATMFATLIIGLIAGPAVSL